MLGPAAACTDIDAVNMMGTRTARAADESVMSSPLIVLQQNQVVPVYQFRGVDVAELRFDFTRRRPQDAPRIRRAVVDEPARDFAAVFIETAHGLSALEIAE